MEGSLKSCDERGQFCKNDGTHVGIVLEAFDKILSLGLSDNEDDASVGEDESIGEHE